MNDSLLEEKPVAEESLLPDETLPATPAVLKNDQEVAGVIAMAGSPVDFSKSFKPILSSVQAGNHEPLLTDILIKDNEENILAAKALALAYARNRDAEGLRNAAEQQRQLSNTVPNASNDPAAALHSATVRALEETGLNEAVRRYKDYTRVNEAIDGASRAFVTRSFLAQAASQVEEKATTWDKIKAIGHDLLSFYSTYQENATLNRIFGERVKNDRLFNTGAAAQDIRDMLAALPPSVQQDLIKQLVDDPSINPARKADLLRKVAQMTRGEFVADTFFRTMDATLAVDLLRLIGGAARRGVPGKVLADAAGEETAGKAAAADILNQTSVTGWTPPELFARAIAAGKMPMDVDPAAVHGLSATVQTELKQRYNDMLDAINNRLNASGMSKEEIAKAADEIRSSYLQSTDKSIYHVHFGEASVDGQKLTMFLQGNDGRVFLSKGAAVEHAAREGIVDYKVVPVNAVKRSGVRQMLDLDDTPNISDGSDISLEVEAIKQTEVPALRALLKDLQEEVKAIQKNYQDYDGGSSMEVFQRRAAQTHIKDLLKNIRTIKTADDLDEWDTMLNQVRQFDKKGRLTPAEDVLQGGKTLHVSTTLDKNLQPLLQSWRKMLGLDSQRLIVVSNEDLPRFAHLVDAPGVMSTRGFHAYSTKVGAYVIAINKEQAKRPYEMLQTAAHELGHNFDSTILRQALSTQRDALWRQYDEWRKARRKDNFGVTVAAQTQLDEATLAKLIKPIANTKGVRLADLNAGDALRMQDERLRRWLSDFPEFWADQFAKFLLTDAVPRTALEEFFAKAAVALRTFYTQVREKLGELLGRTDPERPVPSVAKLLSQHIENVREGRFTLEETLPMTGEDLMGMEAKNVGALLGGGTERRRGRDVGVLLGAGAREAGPPGWLLQVERTDPYSYSSIGKFSQKDIESMPFLAIDPKHRASEQAVEARVVGVHGEAMVRKELTDFIIPYYKKLSRAGTQRVGALLKEGDSFSNAGGVGKEFTAIEAMAKGLSQDEAVAYLATRQLRMAMYHIRNKELVQHMRAQGLKEVELVGTGIRTAGREVPVPSAGQELVYSFVTKTMVDPGALTPSQKLIRLHIPTEVDGELRQLMVVDNATAKIREIQTALSYRPGEYARIYSDEYFIRRTVTRTVDGKATPVEEVVRTAASAREAEAFVSAVKAGIQVLKNAGDSEALQRAVGGVFDPEEFRVAYASGEFDGMTDLSFHFTRNQEEYLNGSVQEALAYGRTFYSQRNEKVLGMTPNRENTLSVFDSLEREVTNVSRVANITQWREQMIRRWMNTFGDLIPNRTGDDVADFFSAADAHFTKGGKEVQFAQRTHRYIMRQIGLRTQEERLYEQVTRQLTEKFFTGNEVVESVGAKVRKMGVLGFVRNINFNLNLGMFNPAQLLVQANGAATALILSPLHGAAAAKTFPLLRMALMSDNPDVWKFFSKVDAATVGNSEEFVKLVKAVRQTGIIDNIRSTALYNLEDGKLNIFGGYPQRVLGSHAFFFNRGEEFARLVSFDVARREWSAANPGLDWTSKEALAQIIVRQDDLTQNMTRANLARFQEGAMSIPMQFAQYNIKLAANVMSALLGKGEGRGFTKREALQLMAGHLVLYGAAGNGVLWLVDEMLDKNTKDSMSVEQKTYLSQGLLSGLLNQIGEWFTGEKMNVALGSRLGAFDYYQKLADAVFTDPKNVYDALLGPTVATAKRASVIADVVRLWYRDPDLTAQDVMQGLAQMTQEQFAVLRNASKAYLFSLHQGKMLDKNGIAIAELTSNEVLAQALGFQPSAAVDVHNLIQSKKDHGQALDDIATLIMKVQRDIVTARLRGNHSYAEEQHKLLSALWPDNMGDVAEVRRRIRDRLYPYDTEFQKLLGEYVWKGQSYDKPLVVTEQPRKANGSQ